VLGWAIYSAWPAVRRIDIRIVVLALTFYRGAALVAVTIFGAAEEHMQGLVMQLWFIVDRVQ